MVLCLKLRGRCAVISDHGTKSLYIRCLRFLREGDQIEIIFGNQNEGSPGWLMQTFCESAFTFQITVDPFATQDFVALPKLG